MHGFARGGGGGGSQGPRADRLHLLYSLRINGLSSARLSPPTVLWMCIAVAVVLIGVFVAFGQVTWAPRVASRPKQQRNICAAILLFFSPGAANREPPTPRARPAPLSASPHPHRPVSTPPVLFIAVVVVMAKHAFSRARCPQPPTALSLDVEAFRPPYLSLLVTRFNQSIKQSINPHFFSYSCFFVPHFALYCTASEGVSSVSARVLRGAGRPSLAGAGRAPSTPWNAPCTPEQTWRRLPVDRPWGRQERAGEGGRGWGRRRQRRPLTRRRLSGGGGGAGCSVELSVCLLFGAVGWFVLMYWNRLCVRIGVAVNCGVLELCVGVRHWCCARAMFISWKSMTLGGAGRGGRAHGLETGGGKLGGGCLPDALVDSVFCRSGLPPTM